jgi:hypothetical protein
LDNFLFSESGKVEGRLKIDQQRAKRALKFATKVLLRAERGALTTAGYRKQPEFFQRLQEKRVFHRTFLRNSGSTEAQAPSARH